jgi:hypothetical protein
MTLHSPIQGHIDITTKLTYRVNYSRNTFPDRLSPLRLTPSERRKKTLT